ncbi:MAG: inorganic triphosphatase [Succinivibrionaceae bacterium]
MLDEIEIKFMIERGDVTDLEKSINDSKIQILKSEELSLGNYYYDTKNQDLYKSGIALRVRSTDDNWEMTIKTRKQVVGGMHIHPEYNIKLDKVSDVPNLSLFPKEIFSEIDLDNVQNSIYQNMSQKCNRTIFLVKDPIAQGEVEICFDKVTYKSKDGYIESKEIELELKKGTLDTLKNVVMKILDHKSDNLILRLGNLSKMHRAAIYAGISKLPEVSVITEEFSDFKEILKYIDINENAYILSNGKNDKAYKNLKYLYNLIVNKNNKNAEIFVKNVCFFLANREFSVEEYKKIISNISFLISKLTVNFLLAKGEL